jgi:hypothetical protein
MATKTYYVVSPLQHDGKDYPIGGKITLEEAAAKPLLGHTLSTQKPETAAPTEENEG